MYTSYWMQEYILSRVRGSVTHNNGFWIGFICPSINLHSTITAHNQWLSKTRSIPYWTTSAFSSYCDWLGSDLRVGHFFSFRCPLANTPQLNTTLSYEWWPKNDGSQLTHSRMKWTNSFVTSGRTEYKSPYLTVPVILFSPPPSNGLPRLFVVAGMRVWRAVG
jgi:hypothetical protein